jgi:hypothetical protein
MSDVVGGIDEFFLYFAPGNGLEFFSAAGLKVLPKLRFLVSCNEIASKKIAVERLWSFF